VSDFLALDRIEESVAYVRQRLAARPRVGLILGSGLNSVAEAVQDAVAIPFAEIPHFPTAGIQGHVGRLVGGHLEGQAVVVMQGRAHYYEGFSMARIGLPVRVMQSLGAEVLIVTNAAGGLNVSFRAGDVMVIRDHISLVGMTGLNPLRGPNLDTFGPRFPDMSCAYDPMLRAAARAVAERAGIPSHEGVYICLSGPNFETPADIRFLRLIGADAVGMSTVPEVTVARHGGMRVLGLSGISNVAAPEGDQGAETTHEEVLEAGRLLAPRMETIIRGVLRGL
jgi:purine-nucleoside phosphorylase